MRKKDYMPALIAFILFCMFLILMMFLVKLGNDVLTIIFASLMTFNFILFLIFGILLLFKIKKVEKLKEYESMINYAHENDNLISTLIIAIDGGYKFEFIDSKDVYHFFYKDMEYYYVGVVYKDWDISFAIKEKSIEWDYNNGNILKYDEYDFDKNNIHAIKKSMDNVIKQLKTDL